MNKVTHTIIEGMALVFCAPVVPRQPTHRSHRRVTMPFALVTALIVMHEANMSANLFSLAAVDYGIIVDGAIVVAEAVLYLRETRPTERLTEDAVFTTMSQVARPIFLARSSS